MPNRLADTESPYLLQHKDNPVDWYPWGDEAFARAQAEDKPVFLSIGYATCHWCHVMEHESFEDPEVAARMNDVFVSVKVDREERPDIDQLYMSVCQMMRGRGGWPLTVLLTPEKRPFYAATYLPKHGRMGRMGMMDLMDRIETLWNQERDQLEQEADKLVDLLESEEATDDAEVTLEESAPEPAVLDDGITALRRQFDTTHGGFGGAPKFPTPHTLLFLSTHGAATSNETALDMVDTTLTPMMRGGINDHIGGGLHRYATDAIWRLPHFEKMLYDQALLLMALADAHRVDPKGGWEAHIEQIVTYLTRDLRDETGAFYSAEDADSEDPETGESREGAFYVWTMDDLREHLDAETVEQFATVYSFQEQGNFEEEATGERTGENVLHRADSWSALAEQLDTDPMVLQDKMDAALDILFEVRETRPRPFLDDKILTDWNGLLIAGLARASRSVNSSYATLAEEAAAFLCDTMLRDDGRLWHRYRNGSAGIEGTLADYAYLAWGLLDLYEATLNTRWLGAARTLGQTLYSDFADTERGGFYMAPSTADDVIVRQQAMSGGARPSGTGVAIYVLYRLYRMLGTPDFVDIADRSLNRAARHIRSQPGQHTTLLWALHHWHHTGREIVIAGDPSEDAYQALLQTARDHQTPEDIVMHRPPGDDHELFSWAPHLQHQPPQNGTPTAYVCEHFTCDRPTTNPKALAQQLR